MKLVSEIVNERLQRSHEITVKWTVAVFICALDIFNNHQFQASGDYSDGDMCENEDDDELYDECLYQRYISDRTLDGVYESSRVKFFSTTGDLVIFTMSLVFCTIAIILFILLLKL